MKISIEHQYHSVSRGDFSDIIDTDLLEDQNVANQLINIVKSKTRMYPFDHIYLSYMYMQEELIEASIANKKEKIDVDGHIVVIEK